MAIPYEGVPACSVCSLPHYGRCPMTLSPEKLCIELSIRDTELAVLRFALAQQRSSSSDPSSPCPLVSWSNQPAIRHRPVVPGTVRHRLLDGFRGDDLTARELAERSGVSFNATSSTLSRMAKSGYVERVGMTGAATIYRKVS